MRLSLKQASRMLQLNDKTVVKLIKSGQLRGFKLNPAVTNSQWMIPIDAVEEYMAYQSAQTELMGYDEEPSERPKTLLEVFTGEKPYEESE